MVDKGDRAKAILVWEYIELRKLARIRVRWGVYDTYVSVGS